MPAHTIETHRFPRINLGSDRFLKVIRYNEAAGDKKAYVQAGLHADEAPGFLVMHHLINRLDRASKEGDITGEIVLVPVANPIGLAQWRDEWLQGRFDFFNNLNFNRNHLDLTDRIAERVKDILTDTPEKNVNLIRRCTREILSNIEPMDEAEFLKHLLLSLCYDADVVLDLHCDDMALMHIYIGSSLWPDASDLSAQLGADVTLLADDSGVTPFDEACSRLWWKLAEKFPQHPIPSACLSATVELRGATDVNHTLAKQDAENILIFLKRRGFIRGDVPEIPKLSHEATPLAGVEQVKTHKPGVVVFMKEPGQRIEKGDVIAQIINPLAMEPEEQIHEIKSTTEGTLFARKTDRFARPGRIIAKIAGKIPIKKEGENLLTL